MQNYRAFLKKEYVKRRKRNRLYTLRAFSRDLGLPVSRLSEVLSEKCGISQKRAHEIANRLGLNKNEVQRFCDLVEMEHARSPLDRLAAKRRIEQSNDNSDEQLREDIFSIVSDWYHFAMLEVMELLHAPKDPKGFAKLLQITEEEAELALERLERAGLAVRDPESSRWLPSDKFTAGPDGIPSAAVRKYHQQILKKASTALQERPMEERCFSAMVFSMDRKHLPYAKKKIKEFRRKLQKEISAKSTGSKNSVYVLGAQLFELTQVSEKSIQEMIQ